MTRQRRSRGAKFERSAPDPKVPTQMWLRVLVEFAERWNGGKGEVFTSCQAIADALGRPRTSVEKAIEELEALYGTPLISDQTAASGRFVLTRTGERVVPWAQALLRQLDIDPLAGRETIVVGVSNRVLTFLLPPVVRDFVARLHARPEAVEPGANPEGDIRFVEVDMPDILDGLRKRTIDAGITSVPAGNVGADLAYEVVVAHVDMALIAAPGSAGGQAAKKPWMKRGGVRLGELAGETVCALEVDLKGVLGALPAPLPGASRIIVDNYSSVTALVRAGGCIGFIPALYGVEGFDDPAQCGFSQFPVADELRPRDLAVWVRAGEEPSGNLTLFLECVKEGLKTVAPSGGGSKGGRGR